MIEFRVLGRLDLRGSEGEGYLSILAQPKRTALLAYLAVATPRGFHRRDKLIGLFWPERDSEHARGALRNALYFLRQSLGDGLIAGRGAEEVGLAAGAFRCDAVGFESALEAGEYAKALELYQGDLLEGFYVAEAPEFERWLEGERARLRARAAEAAWSLAEDQETAGNWVESARWARRAVSFSPDDEGGIRRLLELLDRVGDRAGAMKEYEAFARRLQEEYEGEPSPETQALIAMIREREKAAGDPATAGATEYGQAVTTTIGVEQRERSERRWAVRAASAAVAAVVVVALGSVGIAGYRASTAWKRVPLDSNAVAVMPFRVTAMDPALSGLDEGIVDLMYAIFTGDVGPRAIEPNALLLAWRDRQSRGSAESVDAPLRLAAHFGAGQLLEGALVQVGPEVALNAWLRRVPDGEVLARHTVTGSPDSVHTLVRQLAVGLMGSQLGERAERLASLEGRSPQAIEAYLAGTRAYREGKYQEAIRLLDRAIELDSTFALAGLRLAEVGELARISGGGGAVRRGLQFAAPLRETLSRRDRAAVTALMFVNPADTFSAWMGQREALRAWVDLAPDDALAWRYYADHLRYSGSVTGLPNWEREARRAFERAWDLDSTTAVAVEDHVQRAVWTEDIEWLRRVGPRYLAVADTSGDYWTANRWVIALALGDSMTVQELRARARAGDLPGDAWPVLWRLWTVGRTLGSPQVRDEEILLSQFRSQLEFGIDSVWYMHYEVQKGIETGRLRHVAELLAGPWGRYWGSKRFGPWVFVVDYWLLYPGFDSLVTVAFDSLRSYAALPVPRSRRPNHQSRLPLRYSLLLMDCYVQLYRAARDDTVGVREAVRRQYPVFREYYKEGVCPALVEAMLEAQDQRRLESPALDRLEALLRDGNYAREYGTTPAVPFLARQRRLRGEFERGLAVTRMRGLSMSFYLQMRPALFKEEGDLAAIVGDTAGAIEAYTRYLNLRTDPDPELQAEVDSVRMALDGLLRASR